ncbi:MAG: hypothetical protein P8Z75_03290, partial [Gammaproteobacteria bacterium]
MNKLVILGTSTNVSDITHENTHMVLAGEDRMVLIDGPATNRWKTLTRNQCKWGSYRRNILKITKIDGKNIHIN